MTTTPPPFGAVPSGTTPVGTTSPSSAPTVSEALTTAPPRLAARGLVKTFGPTTALAGVDVDLADGESLAVMGPSGSGKSTLLHCLAGILTPDDGSVTLRGREVATLNETQRSMLRRRHYGFVFQFGQLLSELPAQENVALPLMLLGTPRREAVDRARGWLHALGLAGMETRRPGELSGGQAQRVAVARALITSPDVVFADEPTGALDQTTGAEVMQVLTEATRHAGASLVLVTHDEHVASWCSRRLEVRDGLVVADSAQPTASAATRQAGAGR